MRSHKYWAKPDLMLTSDVHEEAAPIDDVKKTHVPRKYKVDVTEKVQNLNHFKSEAEDLGGVSIALTHPRWTEIMSKLLDRKSVYDDNPTQRESLLKYDMQPMPSTFSKNGIFNDPLESYRQRYYDIYRIDQNRIHWIRVLGNKSKLQKELN